jgi:hypothetical protein
VIGFGMRRKGHVYYLGSLAFPFSNFITEAQRKAEVSLMEI